MQWGKIATQTTSFWFVLATAFTDGKSLSKEE